MLVPALALNLSSEDVYVATQVLELLAVIMVDGRNGHRAILDAMDYFKLVCTERFATCTALINHHEISSGSLMCSGAWLLVSKSAHF